MTTEEVAEKRAKNKVHVVNFAKLASAIAALAAALTGYMEVRKTQANMLEVVSDKVDAIVLKVAYLEGRIEGLAPRAAAEEAKRKVLSLPVPGFDSDGIPIKVVTPPPSMGSGHLPDAAAATAVTDHRLYRQMPRNLQALQAVVNRKVDELEFDKLQAAADSPDGDNL